MTASVLDARALSRRLGPRREVLALRDADLALGAGEVAAVIGPSGSGKSTLLSLLGLLDRPDTGSLFLCGEDVGAKGDRARAALRLAKIGFVFQRHHLLPSLSARENVALPAWRLYGDRRRALARADALLELVGLARVRHAPAEVLSQGEAQRVAAARAVVNDPVLVLADEPTGSLDSVSARETMDLLLRLGTRGAALCVVTHDASIASRAERVYALRDGVLRRATAAETIV